MNISDIAIRVIEQLMSEGQLAEMAERSSSEDSEDKVVPIPENFPKEIQNPIIKDIYGDENENPESNDGEYIILGSYTPMNSPGIITFYVNNITRYTGSLIRKLVKSGFSFNLELVVSTAFLVVKDVMFHELFHYYCDYKRRLTSATFDRDKEEALAVAHSYLNIGRHMLGYRLRYDFYHEYRKIENHFYSNFNMNIGRGMRWRVYSEEFKNHHYNAFTSKGYRDWQLYINRNSYETDFYDYIKNSQLDVLLSNGVPMNDIRAETMIIGSRGTDIIVK